MKPAVYFLLIACLVSSSCAAGIGNQGVAINGTIISTVNAANALACASACDKQAACQAWSLNATSSKCNILSSAISIFANASSISSARLGEVGIYRNGSIGNSSVLATGSTASACANWCTNVTSCVAWNYNTANRNCTLLTAIPANSYSISSMTSGVQGVIRLYVKYYGINTVILGANTTATQCSRFCSATAGCVGWLYMPPTANPACGGVGGPIVNSGMCWAKGLMYTGLATSSCYVTGYQPKSTAVAPVINRTTPADIVAGLPSVSFPFNNVVAFGDNLSDNGNGSYAHCVAWPGDCGNKIYNFGTWTDGPVAVSYLAGYLKMNLTADYAYGHAVGGSKFGATVDNNFTQSDANATDAGQQISNYTSTNPTNIGKTLHFLWIGANDIQVFNTHNKINLNSNNNSVFATNFTMYLTRRIQSLIDAGAKYIFVPNIYPKQYAPVTTTYWIKNRDPTQIANLGAAIAQTNAAINASIATFASSGAKVIYHDVYSFMLDAYLNATTTYGITHINGEYCDGYSQLDWELCVTDLQYGHRDQTFYWMQALDMTSYVHNLVAANMYKSLVNAFQ